MVKRSIKVTNQSKEAAGGGGQRLEALDFVLSVLREHEKSLSDVVTKLEAISRELKEREN